MNNPDFSKSPEHVALANTLKHAITPRGTIYQDEYLAMADAVITHLGSGYRLPEATDANAERLAQAQYFECDRLGTHERARRIVEMKQRIDLFRSTFAEPAEKPEPAPEHKCNCADCNPANWPDTSGWRCGKKPEPVFPGMPAPEPTCPECGRELRAIDATAGVCWRCRRRAPDGSLAESTVAKNATVPCTATSGDHRCELEAGHEGLHESGRIDWEDKPRSEEGPGPDFAGEAAARERNRLIEAFMHDLVGNPAVMAKMLEFYGNDRDAEMGARVAYMAHAFAKEIR